MYCKWCKKNVRSIAHFPEMHKGLMAKQRKRANLNKRHYELPRSTKGYTGNPETVRILKKILKKLSGEDE